MELERKTASYLPDELNRLLLRISLVSIVFVAPFLVSNLLAGRIALGVIGSLIVAIFVTNAWAISRHGHHYPQTLTILLTPLIVGCLILLIHTEGVIGAFWCFPAVVSAYFMLPKREACIANALVLAATVPVILQVFEIELAARILATLTMVSFFSAIFVSVISGQRERMQTVNDGLRAEIKERVEAERKLASEIGRHQETARDFQWALEEAREANAAKSRFLSGMTHELRTPLNAIIGFSQMLDGRGGPLTDAQKTEYIGYILNSGDRLYGLINQVLDLAGIEAGKLAFATEEVGPKSLIARVVDEVSLLAAEREVTVHNETTEGALPYVAADSARMTQALVNLVSNAIKYNRQGGSVHISAEEKSDFLRISVVDTGLGIAADKQNEVFETFNRLGIEASGIEGSGVGLALTREFIQKMGGSIGFESVSGKGSTFWFELPIAKAESLAAPVAVAV